MTNEHRGFASMDPIRRREIASRGGRAAHKRGTAHEWTQEEAREAGRKGGAILLRSGDNPATARVEALAMALDEVALKLAEIRDERSGASTRAIVTMRRSLEKAAQAIDQIEKRMSS